MNLQSNITENLTVAEFLSLTALLLVLLAIAKLGWWMRYSMRPKLERYIDKLKHIPSYDVGLAADFIKNNSAGSLDKFSKNQIIDMLEARSAYEIKNSTTDKDSGLRQEPDVKETMQHVLQVTLKKDGKISSSQIEKIFNLEDEYMRNTGILKD